MNAIKSAQSDPDIKLYYKIIIINYKLEEGLSSLQFTAEYISDSF